MGYLSNAGLSYFFGKLKTIFAPISHGHGGATQSAAGFMSAADKKKLDGIAEGANKYSLPTATSNVLGGVKTGANITNSNGVLSVTAADVTNALGYAPPKQDTNTWRPVVNSLTSDSTTDSLSAAQGKALKTLVDGKAAMGHTHKSVIDNGNGTNTTTFAYSKAGMNYGDYTWLAGWNGYELRTINKNQFATASHNHNIELLTNFNSRVYDATISRTAATVLAAPATANGVASFRKLTASDLPSHTHAYLPLAGGTVTGVTAFTNITASTSKTTGAVKVSGGVGVAGRMSANEVMIGDGCTLRYDATNKCVNFTFS